MLIICQADDSLEISTYFLWKKKKKKKKKKIQTVCYKFLHGALRSNSSSVFTVIAQKTVCYKFLHGALRSNSSSVLSNSIENWFTAEIELLKLNKTTTCISSTESSNPDSYNTQKTIENFDRPKQIVSSERDPRKYMPIPLIPIPSKIATPPPPPPTKKKKKNSKIQNSTPSPRKSPAKFTPLPTWALDSVHRPQSGR